MLVEPFHYPLCNSHAKPLHGLSPPHSMTHIDFRRAWNLKNTYPKWHVFHRAPEATWRSMSGIGRPPPNTAKHPKAVWSKPFTTSTLPTKKVTIHPATWQMVTLHPYPPNWFFAHKSKKNPQIIVFIIFNYNFPCTRLWTLKVINPCTLALKRW